MISELCIVAAAGVLSLALRSFHNQACFRIGTLGFIATSFLAGWLLGGSMVLGAVFASTWFLLPWLEILTRARRLRLPLHRQLFCEPSPAPTKWALQQLGHCNATVRLPLVELTEAGQASVAAALRDSGLR